MKTIRKGIFK